MLQNLNESKLISNIELNNKIEGGIFTKGSNKGTAPKSSDIQNMIRNIKKEGK